MNLNNLEKYVFFNKDKVKISSKDIKKGDVFLALKGKNFHGNKFLTTSLNKGARYCITDNKNYKKNDKIIFVKNIYRYLNNLAEIKRNLYKGKVVGITGSAGKTTLKETLAFFLKKNQPINFSTKSYNNELGILLSILNLNLNAKFSIFEIGTNNFGEIRHLTSILRPSEMFITNIQSTHIENFKTKNNIAKEKSDIFISKYNNERKKIYLNITNKPENLILDRAKKEKNLKIIRIDKNSKKYYIKKITQYKNSFKVILSINKKLITIKINSLVIFRIYNLLFCYAFFYENFLNIDVITRKYKLLKPVDGRGLVHSIYFNKIKLKIIDESYNANPDTMMQSIDYFREIKKDQNKKILILGNMNELGHKSDQLHFQLLRNIDKSIFKFIILCGEFFERSVKKLNKPQNNFILLNDRKKIMQFLNKNVHNNDIILIKCSNLTEVNKLTKNILKKEN